MQREFSIVIRKTGEILIPKFPVELKTGDQFIVAKEMRGSQVPEGENWTLNGYTDSGPVVIKH